ncbi:DUF6701 domain-containing protein, partial [Pontibacterium sp.]
MCRSQQAVWIFLLWVFSFTGAYAATPTCSAVFPDGVSSNNNGGKIKIEWASKVISSPNNILATKRLDDRSGGNSCNTTSCGYTGSAAESMDYNTFPNNNNDVEIGYNETRTLLPGNYDDIRLSSNAIATLTPGDYKLRGSLHLRSNAQIRISGTGTVRILLKGNGRFESGSDINAGGDASQLIIYSRGEVKLESNATVTGFIYAKRTVRLYNRAEVTGAVSGKDVELRSSASKVTYLPSAVSSAAFGDLCGGGSVIPTEPPPAATGCAAIWSDGVQSHSSQGEVKFEWRAQVINSPDNIINAVEIDDDSGGTSCGSTTCTASFSASEALDFDGFKSSGGSDFKVEYKQSRTISPGTYKKIELKGQALLTMEPGDYYVTDDFKLKWDSEIRISSGTVRIFARKKFESEGRGRVNSNGNPEQLLILAKDDVKLKNTDDVKAFIYSEKDVELGHGSDVVGGVSGKDVKLKSSNATVTYDADGAATAAFGDICSGGPAAAPEPIAEYRFDECTVDSTLADETGNYNATPNGVSTTDGGVVGKALDLSAGSTSDWVDLPRGVANGLDDFSIALWIKTSVSKSQQEIIQALGSNTNDDELEIYLINSSRVRFQTRDDDVYLDSGSSLTDGSWHHLVITRDGNQGCLYVDGSLQECETGLRSGTLSVPQNAFVLGQEQDSYGGSFSSSQSFEGLMDELKIYNRTLSASDASAIYTNEQAGNNSDGSSRAALNCEPEELEASVDLRFDELSWNGSANEVKDSSTSGTYSGSAQGQANTIANGQVCRAAEVDGFDDYISIDNLSDTLKGTASLSFWIRTNQDGSDTVWRAPALTGVEEDGGTDDIFWGWLDASGRIGLGVGNSSGMSTSSINDNAWHHVVLTRDSSDGDYQVFVDGSLERSGTLATGEIGNSFASLGRVENTGSTEPVYLQGEFDELVVFPTVLSSGQVSTIFDNQSNNKRWDGSDAVCEEADTVDHYGISAPATALTCEAAEVTITAYDSSGNIVAPESGTTITLSTDNAVDGWSLPPNGTPLSGNSYTFDGTQTSVVLNLMNTNPEVLNIDVTDGSATELKGDSAKDPSITFADAAFRFDTIAAQTSGKEGSAVTLSAIQTDADTGRCVALQPNPAANVDVTFAYSCEDPSSCATKENGLTVNGVAVDSEAVSYTTVPVTFNSSGQASLNLNYSDAGQIKVHAAAELAVESAPTKATVVGSSNTFVVAPAGFCIQPMKDGSIFSCSTADANCNPLAAAGEKFTIQVSARQWGDGGTDYCNYSSTPNFELSSLTLQESATVLAPAPGGSDGDVVAEPLSLSKGVGETDQVSIDEVGVFTLTSKDVDYMGVTIPASTSVPIGRFYPKYFVLNDGVKLTNREESSCSDAVFTYMDEEFGAIFSLTAQNAGGDKTENYFGSFAKLNSLSELNVLLGQAPSGGVWTGYSDRQEVNGDAPSWNKGVLSVDLALVFERTGNPDGPYADLAVAIAPVDDDGVQLDSFDIDTDADSVDDYALIERTEIRFGRMQIQNTYGPETASLNQPVFIQYFDGTNFVTNEDDTCTPIVTSDMTLQVEGASALAQGVVTDVTIGSGTTNLVIGTKLDEGNAGEA